MLTLQDLRDMPPNTLFASGIGFIIHPWFNDATKVSKGGSLEEDGLHTMVRWVALRGGIEDWAIYHSMDANLTQADYFNSQDHLECSLEQIARGGAKLRDRNNIQQLVPCTSEALALYRD